MSNMFGSMLRALAAATLLASPAAGAGELNMLNWDNYISPEVLTRFEKETGIRVAVTTAESNDKMYEAIKTAKVQYDLVVPDHYMVERMGREGMLDRIDASKLKNFWQIGALWLNAPHDPLNTYSVPYLWGTTSFVVDTKVLPEGDRTLATLFDPPPAARGRTGFLAEVKEIFDLAGLYLGLPRCTDDPAHLARIEALLMGLKPSVTGFHADNLVDSIADPRHAVHMSWNGDALAARDKRRTLRYAYPKEGVLAWLSAIGVPKGAPHREDALRFINFLLQPEIAALQTMHTRYANPVQGSERFLPPDLRRAAEFTVPASTKVMFLVNCPAAVVEKRDAIFAKVKQ